MKQDSRWRRIYRTTASGKQQFVCLVCGRVSIAPDKECPPFFNKMGQEIQWVSCSRTELSMLIPPISET